jgi:hypothetical protein
MQKIKKTSKMEELRGILESEALVVLSHSVAVYIPLELEKSADAVDFMAKFMAKNFGGVSSYNVAGEWLDGDVMISDKIQKLVSFTSEADLDQNLKNLTRLVRHFGRLLNQECMAVELDGEMFLLK